MTKVIHVSQQRGDDREVYIGREGHGKDGYFGNPIKVTARCPECGEFHTVGGGTLPCFRVYAERRIAEDWEYRRRVRALHGKILVCFCAPHPCHGDVLANLAATLQENPG